MEEAIKSYLDQLASKDELFAKTYAKPNKSIAECCQYITSEARKVIKGSSGFMSDDAVYKLAVHYYDEDDIKIDSKVQAKVSTSTTATPDPSPVNTPSPNQPKLEVKKIKNVEVKQYALF